MAGSLSWRSVVDGEGEDGAGAAAEFGIGGVIVNGRAARLLVSRGVVYPS